MAQFRTRARAIDLLGRQQIAGIPTAINELFKNAYDAYADHVEVDYFRKKKLFILRDDGLGMTKDDFEKRWLVLATESKFTNYKIPPPPIDPEKPLRPVMGEKGIGRLAIASIGRQVLILSRAKRKNELQPLVAAFINWGIFECPGINLDQVFIPVKELAGDIITLEDIQEMILTTNRHLLKLFKAGDIEKRDARFLIREISAFTCDPSDLMQSLPGNLSFVDKPGTHFYISPCDENLNANIDGDKEVKDEASRLEKMLIGFTNTMTPNHPKPNIETAFRDYRSEDYNYFDLIGEESFISPVEFDMMDHHFKGEFDEFGQFKGEIKVYNQDFKDHKIVWSGNGFRPTSCGKFSIESAYLQGDLKQSLLEQSLYSPLKSKLDRYGGLYIYRDGIRILPYGDNDFDFLDIEKNRSKSASYYFFSYRRMIGVVNISKGENPGLVEKAGREGFIENRAYRQLRDILKNFFVQLANDFFREKGSGSFTETFLTIRKEREKMYKAKEQREKRAKDRKNKFLEELAKFFENVQSGKLQEEIETLLRNAEKKMGSVASIEDPDNAGQALIDYEFESRKDLVELRMKYKIMAPRAFSLSKEQRRNWESYLEEYSRVDNHYFYDADVKIGELLEHYKNVLHIEISRRKRIEKHVELISEEAKGTTKKKYDEARKVAEEISTKVRKLTQELMDGLEHKIRQTKIGLSDVKLISSDDRKIYEELKELETPIIEEKDYANSILENIIHQLDNIYWEKDDHGRIVTNAEITEAIEEELEEAKERMFADVELTQLGLAVNIVHHEFNSTVNSLRNGIRDLKRWADVDNKIESTYKNIRTNFEHLDGYLSLLTPFNRRLYRQEEIIKGEEIYLFLRDVFRGRIVRHEISLKRTRSFSNITFKGFRSQFYPVFVNIVDNAIHWLKMMPEGQERLIRLHADAQTRTFYISNNGPDIPIIDIERIFELGFSRKAGGRGMGLQISKSVLHSAGYDIFIGESRKDTNVTFVIKPINNK